MDKRRIGRFRVAGNIVLRETAVAQDLFRNVVVLEASHKPWSDEFHYVAIHPDFDECDFGEEPPEYCARVDLVEVEGGRKMQFAKWEPRGAI